MAEHFSPKEMGLHARNRDYPWTVHGWTWDSVAQFGNLFWTESVHAKLLDVIVENE